MSTYEKESEKVSCGFVNRKTNNNKNINLISKVIKESVAEAAKAHNDKTLELAGAQKVKPLQGGSKLAAARQEVHTTGTSNLKVKRVPDSRRWRNPKKKATKEHKEKISHRKATTETVDFGYEGLFDFTFTHFVTADKDAFETIVVRTLSNIREHFNTNKSLLEMAIGMDAERFFKYLFATVCTVVAGVFAYCACTTGSWLAALIAGLTSLAAAYSLKEDMFEYAKQIAWEYLKDKYELKGEVAEEPSKEELDALIEGFMADGPSDLLKHESGSWLFRAGISIFGEMLQAILVAGVGVAVCSKQKGLIEAISRVPTVANGIGTLIEIILKWVASVCDELFGTDAKSYFSANKELDLWAQAVMETAQQFDDGKLVPEPTACTYVCTMLQTGRQMLVDKMVTTSAGLQLHRACMRELERLQLSFSKQGLGTETKPESYGVLIMGESGVGKSLTTQWLMKMIGARTMSKARREAFAADFHSEVYAVCPEEEHWNGYTNQFFAVIDDLGQQKPAPGAATEGIKIIRMINSNPAKLNMAAMHEKGKVSFGSEWTLGTTNKYTFWDLNIVQPEAFLRRWEVIAIMAPKKEYCTPETMNGTVKERRLDKTKVSKEFSSDVAEFHIQRIVDPQQQTFETVEVLSFTEFEDKLVDDYKKKRQGHANMLKSVNLEMKKRLDRADAEENELALVHEGTITNVITNVVKTVAQSAESVCKYFQTKTCVTVTQRLGKKLRSFKNGLVMSYQGLINMRQSRAQYMLAISVLIAVLVLVVPPLMTKVGDMLKKFELPTFMQSKEIEFTDIDKFLRFMREDQEVFLKKRGLQVKEAPLESVQKTKAMIADHIKRRGCSVYERIHTDKRVGKYVGKAYESSLFAHPTAYSEFGTKYVNGIYQRNVYHMFNARQDKTKEASGGTVLMVKGSLMLINKHFIDQMRAAVLNGTSPKDTVHFVPHGRPDKVVAIPLEHMISSDNLSGANDGEDAIIVNCAPYMEAHRDIVGKFVSNTNVARMQDHCFSVYTPDNPMSMRQHDVVGHFAPVVNIGTAKHKGMFWYNAPTIDGDCGGLLIETEDRDSKSRIVGIHAAGEKIQSASKMAFAQKLSRETIEEWVSKWDDNVSARTTEELDFESSQFMGLNVVRKDSKKNIVMMKNPLVPSYMHGWAGPPTRVPAVLHPYTNSEGEKVNPLANALMKESANNIPIDKNDVAAAVLGVVRTIMPVMKNRDRVLTNEEAVLGFNTLSALKRNTSAGYYGLHNPGVGPCKHGALGREGEYTLDTPEMKKLFEKMDSDWVSMSRGEPMDSPHLLFLKPEKRSLEKVEAGNVRCVKAASFDESLMIRKVYGALVSDLMEAPIVAGPCIGMNPLGLDWDFVTKHISRRGSGKVFAGDFKGFDQSQSGQLLRAVLEVLSTLAGHKGKDTNMVEKCIAESLAAPRCMVGDLVYQNDHGLPSGNPLTSIMNSVFVMLTFRLVWLRIMREPGETRMACMKRFDENVTLIVYGDDHIANVEDEAIEHFNQHSLMETFPDLGLTYTSDDKEDKNPPKYRELSEVTFLKRSFRFEPALGKYVAPLDMQTLKEVCYYTSSKGSMAQITRDNVERTFRELALHGREVYEEMSKELEKIHNERTDSYVVRPPFEIALEEVYGALPAFPPAFL